MKSPHIREEADITEISKNMQLRAKQSRLLDSTTCKRENIYIFFILQKKEVFEEEVINVACSTY